jgi:pimeloyl-ACP methyl ester carboxylesterase
VSLATRELGSGPPLLLLNGYAATRDGWDPTFVERLAAGSRVICPDNPGVGESPAIGGELTVSAIAAEVLALMDREGIAAARVAGWSMGGFVAQELAARHPGRVERLVLLSTDPGGPDAVRAAAEVETQLRDHDGAPREQAMRLLGLLFPPAVTARMDARFGDAVAAQCASLSVDSLRAQERLGDFLAEVSSRPRPTHGAGAA